MRTSRDQGALDPPILSQSRKAQNCYLAMAAMRRWFLTRAAPLCWRAARLPPISDRCAASHRTSRSVFLESYVDLSVARRASAFGACLGSDRAEHIRASLMRLETERYPPYVEFPT
jgi:hypothetical protein